MRSSKSFKKVLKFKKKEVGHDFLLDFFILFVVLSNFLLW